MQSWRIRKALPYLRKGQTVLDIGSADGAMFKRRDIAARIAGGVGIDPDADPGQMANFQMVRGTFPNDLDTDRKFDAITILAVLEHIPRDEQPSFAASCFERTLPGGQLLVTVPGPAVDRIIDVLKAIRVLDGMAEEEHYGFEPAQTVPLFEGAGYKLKVAKKFQLGLNHFFVFVKPKEVMSKVSSPNLADVPASA